MSNTAEAHDIQFMAEALRLAARGCMTVHPNPAVGCVIVKQGKVIARGWHQQAGEPHAEVHALVAAGEQAKGSDVYVTLEPCSHHGRTPPCADALIKAGVRRVVIAMQDPNPEVAGRGLQRIQDAGIETVCGCMQPQAEKLNAGFIQRMQQGRPRVVSKIAISLDGRTAMASGESKWITSDAARLDAHRLRAHSSAILTASATVLADDPSLNVRLPDLDIKRQPDVVIVDTHLRVLPEAKIFKQVGRRVLIATCSDDLNKRSALENAGATLLDGPICDEGVDLGALLSRLATEFEYNQLMVEAGAVLNGSLLQNQLIDELVVYQAPVVLGDEGKGVFHLPGIENMTQRIQFVESDSVRCGVDRKMIFQPCIETR